MRFLFIDDEQLLVDGVEALLHTSLPDVSLDKCADLDSGAALLRSIDYELVLLGWNVGNPRGTPAQSVGSLRDARRDARMLILSRDLATNWRALVLTHGLAGFVPKTAPGDTLIEAIQVALDGRIFLPASSAPAMQGVSPPVEVHPHPRRPELTQRQSSVVELLVRGMSNKAIARELHISEHTVKAHVRGIMQAIGVNRRGEVAFQASRASRA